MVIRRFFKCFISSPGDCQIEREICENVIQELNTGLAKHLDVNFETFMWEYDVLPDMGKNGQEIIDEYIIKSKYDIFIGIMKNRYGQPTKKAGSGTEHELNDALKRKNENDEPRILFFFGKENVDPDLFDHEQYDKVKKFKKEAQEKGIYVNYEGDQNFEQLLKKKLELFIQEKSPQERADETLKKIDLIQERLELEFDESLKTYNNFIPIWIEPIISKANKISKNPSKNLENRINIEVLIESSKNIIIKAPSEFGLTSLAHYLKLEAWKKGKTFIYLDAKFSKSHKIIREINEAIAAYPITIGNKIDYLVIDSIQFEESGTMKLLKTIIEFFTEIPLIILNTTGNNLLPSKDEEDEKIVLSRKFEEYFLLALPQSEIRKLVCHYSLSKTMEHDNDSLLDKITKDLEILNIHRTVKNCLTILKASSKIGSEHNSINRTKLLDTILNIIFEEYELPTYKGQKPDIKDCTFVLGYFVELLITKDNYEFKEEFFKDEIRKFCEENYSDLDINYLFQALVDNTILSKKGNSFHFKSTYWIFYFIAHRMNLDEDFKTFIFTNKKYIDYPEIIEFYTGTDRNKIDAIEVLIDDIKDTIGLVRDKVKIENNINPYAAIAWNPKIEDFEKEELEISKKVIASGLPNELKDKYADKNYDQIKPYSQVIGTVMREYSFSVLMRQITASSRALRNSDFVKPEKKIELLNQIGEAWNEVSKLLIILSPILADKGMVAYDGTAFILREEDFNFENPDEKSFAVLLSVPKNVVDYFKDDLYSAKMGPLICAKAQSEKNPIVKHEFMRLIVFERPKIWYDVIDKYLISLNKNSFFLSDIAEALETQLEINIESEDRRKIGNLMYKCKAKHIFNNVNPNPGLINKVRKANP